MRVVWFAIFVLACGHPPNEYMPKQAPRPRIVAHRGASFEAPENTIAAFKRAWTLGVEAVELDVHVTADGEVVVIHDPTTKRVAGVDRKIAEHTLAELRELDVGAWKHVKYKGERIPTLAQALATIPAGRTMFVEIKSPKTTAPAIGKVIHDAHPTSVSIALQGFDPDALAALAAAVPDAPAYWTVDPPRDANDQPLPYPLTLIDETKRHGFAGLALDYRGVTDELIAAANKQEILLDVWTLNETALLADWGKRDVRWIETDRPELAP
ncbi:MAG TPA: glycerophosphodiester phosphodiesterase family protein [Kofleriaceae bacterium]